MSFRVPTVAEHYTRIALDRTSVTLKRPELEYLILNLTALLNQLARYKLDTADVSACVLSATVATTFFPAAECVCFFNKNDVVFEEVKGYLCVRHHEYIL